MTRRDRTMAYLTETLAGSDAVVPVAPGRRIAVAAWERAVVFRHGRHHATLDPGAHRIWATGLTVRTVDVRPGITRVPMQELPTADGVTVKVSATLETRVVDPLVHVTASQDPFEVTYLATQLALRELVAALSVDDLLQARRELGARLHAGLRGVEAIGLVVERAEVRDIVLPAELRRAQAQVLLARAEGAAALERARGETAALRSLTNAARLATETPALYQLRLLQQLAASSGHTVVIGVGGGTPGLPAPTPG